MRIIDYLFLVSLFLIASCDSHTDSVANENKQVNQPKQTVIDNNQAIDQAITSDKERDLILYESVLNNVLNSENIVTCGDRYFKIKSEGLKLNLNGYEIIEFKNPEFEYVVRDAEDMTELERLNGLSTEIKYNLSFDYFRNYIFRGLISNNNKLMIESVTWSDWSYTNGALANGVFSIYSNKQSQWSHNKNIQTNKPTCNEIIEATVTNYFSDKYADQINQLNLLIPKVDNINYYYQRKYFDPTRRLDIEVQKYRINKLNCFKTDANGELNQERIIFCMDSINLLESEMRTYFRKEQYLQAINKKISSNFILDSSWPEFRCKVEFTQIRGGEVVNVYFLDCPSDLSIRNKVESAFNKSLMPYAGFEDVFQSKVSITFCDRKSNTC